MDIKTAAIRKGLYKAIDYLMEDPEVHFEKAMRTVNRFTPPSVFSVQRQAFTNSIESKNNWYQLLIDMAKLNPDVMPDLLKTVVVDSNILAWPVQEKNRDKYHCNIPWAILLDPTSACNLHCKGCWAAEYGHKLNLSYDDIDSIITQGKELGVHIYIYTGGEPLVRKKDIIKLCEKHQDCAFLCFTNSTLIDEEFCQDMIRVKNFIPAISAEGLEDATDARRGEGVFDRIEHAMDLLKSHKLPFGISACYTHENAHSIASEEYWDWMIEKGALFCWIFTYMPVGVNSPTSLMPDPDDRILLYNHVREMRKTKKLFTLDFQHDGEFVGGCIAGGRRYLHINARGDVEPCVFIHYSNVNIHDVSLLDALRSPLFMEYHNNQPFDGNLLRPCPMLENPSKLVEMVERSGAKSTDLEHEESAYDLAMKCAPQAEKWYPIAKEMWHNKEDERYAERQRRMVGQAKTDSTRFDECGIDPKFEADYQAPVEPESHKKETVGKSA